VRLKPVVAEMLPDVPVIVRSDPPIAGTGPAVKVSALDPEVGLVLHEAETPDGRPVTDSVTGPENPAIGVTVMVEPVEVPGYRNNFPLLCVREKAGTGTVSGKFVVSVILPAAPVMEIVWLPGGVALLAVRVSRVDNDVGLAVHEAVTPAGSPLIDRFTGPANPPMSEMLMVAAVELPLLNIKLPAELVIQKPGIWGPARESIKFCP
jgi:hypothetical protein